MASLLLAIAIVAICLALMREAYDRETTLDAPDRSNARAMVLGLMIGFGVVGAIFSGFLASWNRLRWPYQAASFFGGAFLGAGAAALASLPLPWQVICTVPVVGVLAALLLARQGSRHDESPPGS